MIQAVITEDANGFMESGKPGAILPIYMAGTNAILGFAIRCPGCGVTLQAFIAKSLAEMKGSIPYEVTGYPDKISLLPAFETKCCGWKGELKDGMFIPANPIS